MKNRNGTDLGRRRLLWGAAAGAGGVALAPILYRLQAAKLRDQGSDLQRESPYGLPAPTPDRATGLPLLKLPPDFSYTSAGWSGDPMSDGYPTPDRHDGMGVIHTGPGGDITLIRNHERGLIAPGKPMPFIGGPATPCYDNLVLPGRIAGSGGGTTALRFREGELIDARATLAGTLVNCSGGPTGFGSWLSCEEIVLRGSPIGARDHGWVFEVPAPEFGPASARPIRDMGLMRHEATARDPATGLIYLTEDNGAHSGFYRFTPHDRAARIGALEAGGRLAMLKVVGRDNADLTEPEIGATFAVEWVSIPDPDADPERLEAPAPGLPKIRGAGKSGPFLQGEARGAAGFSRGEGCHYHQGVIYMVDTSGGAAGSGAVWAYQDEPAQGSDRGTLTAIFVAPDEATADSPDTIAISPRGGLLLCEDGSGRGDGNGVLGNRMLGLDATGRTFGFAENNLVLDRAPPTRSWIAPGDYRRMEFTGACFDPGGRWLFVNIQTPGITFAITGPWERGTF
ncbi:MAG: DUF839 domain-containing protein [Gammaproteobacteria bacterium]|nr:DUF839 domain-containing protein [Gammaproteobacteria bacterium]